MDEAHELPCHDKIVFDTARQARDAAIVAKYQRDIQLTAYKCRYCKLWHLSSGSVEDDS